MASTTWTRPDIENKVYDSAASAKRVISVDSSGNILPDKFPINNNLNNINTTYNDTTTTATSQEIDCEGYETATLTYSLVSSGSPTDIVLEVEISPDGTNWFKLTNGFLGDLRFSDASVATQINEAVLFSIASKKIRVKVTATGTSASNTFTLSNANLYLK